MALLNHLFFFDVASQTKLLLHVQDFKLQHSRVAFVIKPPVGTLQNIWVLKMLGNDIEADKLNANVFDIFSLSLADRFSSKQ